MKFSQRVAGYLPGLVIAGFLVGAPVFAQDVAPIQAGHRAPNFATTTLDGQHFTLKSLRGHVVLLDIWATWCGPCRMSTPTIESLDKTFHAKGLRVVGLSLDDPGARSSIHDFINTFGVTYTLAYAPKVNERIAMRYNDDFDPDQSRESLGHPVPPAVYLIDQKGIVRWSQIGYSLDEKQVLTPMIKKLLSMHR